MRRPGDNISNEDLLEKEPQLQKESPDHGDVRWLRLRRRYFQSIGLQNETSL